VQWADLAVSLDDVGSDIVENARTNKRLLVIGDVLPVADKARLYGTGCQQLFLQK